VIPMNKVHTPPRRSSLWTKGMFLGELEGGEKTYLRNNKMKKSSLAPSNRGERRSDAKEELKPQGSGTHLKAALIKKKSQAKRTGSSTPTKVYGKRGLILE